MKSIFAILLLVGMASVAQATVPLYPKPGYPGLPNVDVFYASWCEGQTLVRPSANGGPTLRVDCRQTNQVCKQQENRVSSVQIIISAGCWYR